MLYFPHGQLQPYNLYRRQGGVWLLKHEGTHMIRPRVFAECQAFLSLWLNKNVQHSTSNGVNADPAVGSQA